MKFDLTKLEVFEQVDEYDIRDLARGLTLEECANYYGFEKLSDLPTYDQQYLRAHHTRGRVGGKRQAVEELFCQMKNPRTGGNLALQYLTRFADDWPTDGVGASASGFNFKVILDND